MSRSSDPTPLISVALCTRNSKDRVLDTLEGLHNQSLAADSYEVVVIDNASDDGTYEWLEERTETFGFRLIRESKLGLSCARNTGIENTTGEIVYFIDDDAVPPAHLLQALAGAFREYQPDALGGPVHGLWEITPPDWLKPSQWRSLSLLSWGKERRHLEYPEILIGCNVGFRRRVFERYGLFDPNLGRKGDRLLGNEERALERRIMEDGGKVLYEPRAYVFHLVPESRLELDYFKLRARDGAYSAMVMRESEDDAPRRNGPAFPTAEDAAVPSGPRLTLIQSMRYKLMRRFRQAYQVLVPLRVKRWIGAIVDAYQKSEFEQALAKSSREGRELYRQHKKLEAERGKTG